MRSASFSPHPDVVHRAVLCIWDSDCRANENTKLDRVFTEYNVTYSRELSVLKKSIEKNAPSWDLDQDLDGSHNASCPTLQEQASKIASANKAMFDSYASIFKSLIHRMATSNVTSDGALEHNLQTHFIYHSIMTFNCIALPIVLGVSMKFLQLASGINVMKFDYFRRCYIFLCLFSAICVFFDSKLTIQLPYYVSETCIQLTSTLSKLQASYGLYDSSDYFNKALRNCPMKSVKYEQFHRDAQGFGNAPFALQLHKIFTYLIHALRSNIKKFWDSSEVAMSLFVGYQAFGHRHLSFITTGITKLTGIIARRFAFGAAQ